MKTLVIAAIAALTLTLAASAGPNGDPCGTLGCGHNGTSLNGIWSNGVWGNGVWRNGASHQGSSMQGMNMQGTRTHGAPVEVTIGSAVLVRIELPR